MKDNEINSMWEWFVKSTPDNNCLRAKGYRRLIDCPEIRIGIERIADMISSMTIYLMENGENGDRRIKNELSRKIDINPYKYMTRQSWMHWIVKCLLINGNAIVHPIIENDLIADLKPIPYNNVSFRSDDGIDYKIIIGDTAFNYDELLHFKINPSLERPYMGESYSIVLNDVMNNLKQSFHTVNEFLANKVIPSLIIKVDALTDELTSDEGRDRVYDKFVSSSESGKPWIIPAGLIDVEQIKPLTLNDIAIKDTIELSKRQVAGILGIPAFILGVGDFDEAEYNNFIRTRISIIAKSIEQELTKLLYSPDLYFKFNPKSLFAYSLQELSGVYSDLFIKGIVTGNEVRDVMGMSPIDGLDRLTILENYIPLDKIGEQEKLKGGEDGANAN